jgi:hypothetical protein
MQHRESDLQSACVRWFRYQYPKYDKILFSVPNGGHRNKLTAISMKREGQVAGVSDLILLLSNGKHSSLCIEMKAEKGKQTDLQKEFQQVAEQYGNKYIICHSFDEFKTEIETYLNA